MDEKFCQTIHKCSQGKFSLLHCTVSSLINYKVYMFKLLQINRENKLMGNNSVKYQNMSFIKKTAR